MADQITLNMAGLVAISNAANEGLCRELAEKAKSAMEASAASFAQSGDYAASFSIDSEPRTGTDDFAHTYVRNTAPYALKVEAKHGTMARGLAAL